MKHVLRMMLLVSMICLTGVGAMATPIGGLTVAVSPDGESVIVSGVNRAFLRLNPATLEVEDRVWHGLSVTRMAFSRDGSVLAVTDAGMGGVVTIFDSKTLKRITDVRDCDPVALATQANLVAGIRGNRSDTATLQVFGMKDGRMTMQVPVVPKRTVTAIGMDLKGTVAAVLYEGIHDSGEAKATPDAALRGIARIEAVQKSDGKTAMVEFFAIPSGKKLASHTLFYSCSGDASAVIRDGRMIVVNYQNQNAVIGQDGLVAMFECANSFNYGIGFSSDYEFILTGGLANFSVTGTGDRVSREVKVREKLPSWPEYFRGFAASGSGTCYGSTDGFRVFAIDRNASIILEKAIY
ncbi:hypothetical protein JXA80_13945 [bacterium]|nr:hypothetical protein [candidate division CSSED10-310 bacterium]